jgi:hypothetical protein
LGAGRKALRLSKVRTVALLDRDNLNRQAEIGQRAFLLKARKRRVGMTRIPTYVRYDRLSPDLFLHVTSCPSCDRITEGPMAGYFRLCEHGKAEQTFDIAGFGQLDFEHGASGEEG